MANIKIEMFVYLFSNYVTNIFSSQNSRKLAQRTLSELIFYFFINKINQIHFLSCIDPRQCCGGHQDKHHTVTHCSVSEDANSS